MRGKNDVNSNRTVLHFVLELLLFSLLIVAVEDDTAADDDDNETDTDYDDLNDEETNATPTLDQETKDYMAYVQLPASGTEKK